MSARVDLEKLLYVQVTSVLNQKRLRDSPPEISRPALDHEDDLTLREYALRDGKLQDNYRDVLAVSFMRRGSFSHLLVSNGTNQGPFIYPDEKTLIRATAEAFKSVVEVKTEYVTVGPMLAGWQLKTKQLPLLITKSMRYHCSLPDCYLADPTRQYSTVEVVLDISTLYTQGVRLDVRRLPSLHDALRYWAVPIGQHSQRDCIEAIQAGQAGLAIQMIEQDLVSMDQAVRRYYGEAA